MNGLQIGGNIAKNAGGLSTVKYGVTRDYVKGLEVVLSDGKVIRTGAKTIKFVVGYDLTRLFIGSEGTLGIITKAILKLVPRPQTYKNILVIFENLKDAVNIIKDIFALRITPRMVELMDDKSLKMLKDYLPEWSDAMKGTLIIECDGYAEQVNVEIAAIKNILQEIAPVYLKVCEKEDGEYKKVYSGRSVLAKKIMESYGTVVFEDLTTPRSQTW